MKQGGSPPTGKWIGSPSGGVQAPDPIRLPDPARRFATTASRLDDLADGHPMADWLRLMASLSRAQHHASRKLALSQTVDETPIRMSVANRMPPLAAETHHRDPVWQQGLSLLLDANAKYGPKLDAVANQLRTNNPSGTENLANAFLTGGIEAGEAAPTLFIAAALQLYFTLRAAALGAHELRLLPERGLCPCCGSTPVAGLVTASGKTPGSRYLYCSLCSTEWNHVRAICITCGGSGKLSLQGIEGDNGAVKAETCGDCGTYAKMLYEAKDTHVDPYADDLATLGLDMMVAEAGWKRHAPNPLLLVG